MTSIVHDYVIVIEIIDYRCKQVVKIRSAEPEKLAPATPTGGEPLGILGNHFGINSRCSLAFSFTLLLRNFIVQQHPAVCCDL